MELVVSKIDEPSVEKGVLDISVSEQLHYLKDALGFVVFRCGFPVSECMEGYLQYAVVLQFEGNCLSLSSEPSYEAFGFSLEDLSIFDGQAFCHWEYVLAVLRCVL